MKNNLARSVGSLFILIETKFTEKSFSTARTETKASLDSNQHLASRSVSVYASDEQYTLRFVTPFLQDQLGSYIYKASIDKTNLRSHCGSRSIVQIES